MFRSFTVLSLSTILLTSCASTTKVWKHSLPDNPAHLTKQEAQEYYQKFAIKNIDVWETSFDKVITLKEPEQKYFLLSFAPTIEQISPTSTSYLESYEDFQKFRLITASVLYGMSLTPILYSSLNSNLSPNDRFLFYGTSMCSMIISVGIGSFLNYSQGELFKKMKLQYNKDLKKYLYLEPNSLSSQQLPGRAIKLGYQF